MTSSHLFNSTTKGNFPRKKAHNLERAQSGTHISVAWNKQRELKHEKIPTIKEVIDVARDIQNDRDQALFVLAYLTAGRIAEIVRKRTPRGYRESLHVNDLKQEFVEGRPILLINIRNQKNRGRFRKEIPVPLDLKENKIFLDMITPFLNSLYEDAEMFPIQIRRAYDIIDKEASVNPHWIRHIRLTHLVTVYDYKEHQLIRYAGWTDSRPAKNYIEMNWKDLIY